MSSKNDLAQGVLPADSYNGLVVGAARQIGGVGKFRRISSEITVGADARQLVHLIAPGASISVPTPTPDGLGTYVSSSGTSVAAPHATGTIALLAQDAVSQGLGADARRHQVMKAVLINSAEKVEGRLGMGRTLLTKAGAKTWDQSDARDEVGNEAGKLIPLDVEMGAGFLNAKRARTQLRGGQFGPQNPNTPAIGWDYGSVNGPGEVRKYTLPTLKGGSWISATLSWDRTVVLQDNVVQNGLFDPGEGYRADARQGKHSNRLESLCRMPGRLACKRIEVQSLYVVPLAPKIKLPLRPKQLSPLISAATDMRD
jgi:subtilisin family serine protease